MAKGTKPAQFTARGLEPSHYTQVGQRRNILIFEGCGVAHELGRAGVQDAGFA